MEINVSACCVGLSSLLSSSGLSAPPTLQDGSRAQWSGFRAVHLGPLRAGRPHPLLLPETHVTKHSDKEGEERWEESGRKDGWQLRMKERPNGEDNTWTVPLLLWGPALHWIPQCLAMRSTLFNVSTVEANCVLHCFSHFSPINHNKGTLQQIKVSKWLQKYSKYSFFWRERNLKSHNLWVFIVSAYMEKCFLCRRRRFLRDCHPGVKPETKTLKHKRPVSQACAKPHHHQHHLHHPSPQSTLAVLIQCLHKTLGSNDSHETMDHPSSLHPPPSDRPYHLPPLTQSCFHRSQIP